jgi:type IV pilus assembly protein PilP
MECNKLLLPKAPTLAPHGARTGLQGRIGSVPVATLPPSLAVGRIGSVPVATLPPSLAVGRIGSVPVATLPPSLAVGRIGSVPVATLPPSLAVVSWVVLMALLAGCGNDDFSDLTRYISEVKARPKEPIKPLPEIKVIEPFMFKPEGLRDPFKALEQPEQTEGADVSTGSGIKPDTTRRKEELEAFPLEVLKMVGTVNMRSSLWGLVKADDGTVYRVKVGNYMGKNYGKIIRIVGDKIELMEIVPDKPGSWREQLASIALTE